MIGHWPSGEGLGNEKITGFPFATLPAMLLSYLGADFSGTPKGLSGSPDIRT
jgi:hypothetical protein